MKEREGDEEGEDGDLSWLVHHHLESFVSPCHGRYRKGGSRSCRGSGGGGGEPRRLTGQSAQLESGVIGGGEEAPPSVAMTPLSAVTTKRRRGHSGGVAGQGRR